MRIIPILLAASLLNACSNTATGPTDPRIVGTWAQREAAGDTLFVLRLDGQGKNVTGTGTYTAEGGRSGTLTETGTISDGALQLNITYDSGATAQFTGAVSDAELSGSIHLGPAQSLTPSYPATFSKKN